MGKKFECGITLTSLALALAAAALVYWRSVEISARILSAIGIVVVVSGGALCLLVVVSGVEQIMMEKPAKTSRCSTRTALKPSKIQF